MEYVNGATIKQAIGETKDKGIEINTAIDYATQIAEALNVAHEKGVIHRDIKSENIMVTPTGQVKVMDFGLAKLRGSVKLTRTMTTKGTLAYSSPEQVQGKEVDARSDIFSFGVVLYEMISGQLPFKGEYDSAVMYSILDEEPEPIQKLCPDISSDLLHILNRALEKEPDHRYQSLKDVIIELRRLSRVDTSRIENKYRVNSGTSPFKKSVLIRTISIGTTITFFMFFLAILIFDPFKPQLPPCIMNDTKSIRLTAQSGFQWGKISPDGHYLLFNDDNFDTLYIKELETGFIERIRLPEDYTGIYSGSWAPEANSIAISVMDENGNFKTLIYNSRLGKIVAVFDHKTQAGFHSWAPNGEMIAYCCPIDSNQFIGIIDQKNKGMRRIELPGMRPFFPIWSKDSKRITFIDNASEGEYGIIYELDINTGRVTEYLNHIKPLKSYFNIGGLVFSPDRRYLIFTGISEGQCDLFAVSTKKNIFLPRNPVRITNLRASESPLWPHFTSSGNRMSYVIENDSWDVYLFSFDQTTGVIGDSVVPIANTHEREFVSGMSQGGSKILLTIFSDNKPDLYWFNLDSKETLPITRTKDIDEGWPEIIPDRNSISYYFEDAIWRIPQAGGAEIRVTPDSLVVTPRHLWSHDGEYLYAVMRDIGTDDYVLFRLSSRTKELEFLFEGLSFDSDIRLSPDGKYMAVTGMNYDRIELRSEIHLLDLELGTTKMLYKRGASIPQGRITWSSDSRFILLDDYDFAKQVVEYKMIPIDGSGPIEIHLGTSALNLVGSLLISKVCPSGKQILIQSKMWESDVWMYEGQE